MSGTNHTKTALIVGEATGIAGNIAVRFAMEGAAPILLDMHGESVDGLLAQFKALALAPPLIMRGDSLNLQQPHEVLSTLKEQFAKVDVFIFAHTDHAPVPSLEEYDEQALLGSIERNTWPLVEFTKQIHAVFGEYPKYVLGINPADLDRHAEGHDFAAVTQSLNEVLVKYMNYHLYAEDIVFNILRTAPHGDDSYRNEVAKGVFALTSGLMDAIRGQTLVIDRERFCSA